MFSGHNYKYAILILCKLDKQPKTYIKISNASSSASVVFSYKI